ncbi:MAG: sugar phosphate isomerase/epimerase family protein [Clostridia bacterium]
MKLGALVRIQDMAQLDRDLAMLREEGCTACHLGHRRVGFNREMADDIRRIADARGIEIVGNYIGYRDAYASYDMRDGFIMAGIVPGTYRAMRMEYLLQGIAFVSWLGITDMIIWAGFIPNNPFDPDYPPLLTSLRTLCEQAEMLGVNIVLETGAESPITMLRVMQEVGAPNIYLCVDTGNAISYGYGNPVEALYTYGSYVRHVHVADAMPPTSCYARGRACALGEGLVDFPKFFSKLQDIGYTGNLIFECDQNNVRQAKDYMLPLLHAQGWQVELHTGQRLDFIRR